MDTSCATGVKLLSNGRERQPWTKEPCVLGIDEAGRGPVLGPMVYAAVFSPLGQSLEKRNYADSKTLTPEKREQLFASMASDMQLGFALEIMSAQFISCNMLARSKISLNQLAFESTVRVIKHILDIGVNLTEVYVDTVGDEARHEERLSKEFGGLKFTVRPKADALYPVVSAASIVAKVVRDQALLQCQQDLGLQGNLGAGYPGDPQTIAWLEEHVDPVFGFHNIVRFSWETCTRMLTDEAAAAISWEADDGACGGSGTSQQSRLSFAPAQDANLVETNAVGRHNLFRTRRLVRLTKCF